MIKRVTPQLWLVLAGGCEHRAIVSIDPDVKSSGGSQVGEVDLDTFLE